MKGKFLRREINERQVFKPALILRLRSHNRGFLVFFFFLLIERKN